MVALLLITILQATPPPVKPAAPPAAPATQAPRPRPSGSATATALLFITDGSGRPIENVTVTLMGPVDREVKSPSSGPTRVEGLRAGTYRVRFAHEKFITFEKEIAWRAGTAQPEMAITLNVAPERLLGLDDGQSTTTAGFAARTRPWSGDSGSSGARLSIAPASSPSDSRSLA